MKVKVLSFNLNLLPALSFMVLSSQGYENERLHEFIKYIDNYDIILLQEVFSSPFMFRLFDRQRRLRHKAVEKGFKYIVRGPQPTLINLIQERKWTDGGLLILSRFKVVEKDTILFSEGTNVDKGASKGCLYAKIQIGKSHLLVFNLHLQATHTFGSKGCNQVRHQQMSEVRRFIQRKCHLNPTCPYILGGDFNCDAISSSVSDSIGIEAREYTESDEYKYMTNIIDPTNRIQDLLKNKYGYHPSTRPPREVIRGGIRGIFKHKYPQRLDYLFFCPPDVPDPEGFALIALPEATDVVTFQTAESLPFDYLSDHYGIETSIVHSQDLKKSGSLPIHMNAMSEEWQLKHLLMSLYPLMIGLLYMYFSPVFLYIIIIITIFYLFDWRHWMQMIWPKKNSKLEKEKNRLKWKRINKENEKSGESGVHLPALTNTDSFSDVHTLYDNFQHGVSHYSHKQCLGYRSKLNKPYKWLTYDDVHRRSINFGSGLVNLGIPIGGSVAIYSENRPEWIICEQACNMYGFVTIPLYDASPTFVEEVLEFTKVQVILCSRPKAIKILSLLPRKPDSFKIHTIIQMQRIRYDEYAHSMESKIKLIPFEFVETDGIMKTHKPRPPNPNDTASIIFTTQASGKIKGAVLSHNNIVIMAKNLHQAHLLLGERVTDNDSHFSYFPLARMFERIVVTLMLYSGASIAFKHPESRFFEETSEVKPTVLYCIPSDFTKLYGKYKIALMSWSPLWAWIFHSAFKHKKGALERGNLLLTSLMDSFIFKKYAAHMGGKLRLIMVSSEGHLPQIHQEFLQILFCCKVSQCYIRTEIGVCTATSETNSRDDAGFPLCQMKVVDVPEYGFYHNQNGGEICVRGDNVIRGYYYNEELTKSRLRDGWFHTGEIGRWNETGTITIMGHRDEMLNPQPNKFVFARVLEFIYAQSHFVHQIFIYCKPLQPLIAIVVPDYEVVVKWAKENAIKDKYEPQFLYKNPQMIEAVLNDLMLQAQNGKLKDYELVRAVYLSTDEIPSLLSLQRLQLFTQYQEIIEVLYHSLTDQQMKSPPKPARWRSRYGDLSISQLLSSDDTPSPPKLFHWQTIVIVISISIIYHIIMVPSL